MSKQATEKKAPEAGTKTNPALPMSGLLEEAQAQAANGKKTGGGSSEPVEMHRYGDVIGQQKHKHADAMVAIKRTVDKAGKAAIKVRCDRCGVFSKDLFAPVFIKGKDGTVGCFTMLCATYPTLPSDVNINKHHAEQGR